MGMLAKKGLKQGRLTLVQPEVLRVMQTSTVVLAGRIQYSPPSRSNPADGISSQSMYTFLVAMELAQAAGLKVNTCRNLNAIKSGLEGVVKVEQKVSEAPAGDLTSPDVQPVLLARASLEEL